MYVCIIDVLKGQPIKLTQFVSNSEFHEYCHWGPAESKGNYFKKTSSLHQFPCDSEVETTWISLIGWPLKTSSM